MLFSIVFLTDWSGGALQLDSCTNATRFSLPQMQFIADADDDVTHLDSQHFFAGNTLGFDDHDTVNHDADNDGNQCIHTIAVRHVVQKHRGDRYKHAHDDGRDQRLGNRKVEWDLHLREFLDTAEVQTGCNDIGNHGTDRSADDIDGRISLALVSGLEMSAET